jgi:hypothetical protein
MPEKGKRRNGAEHAERKEAGEKAMRKGINAPETRQT